MYSRLDESSILTTSTDGQPIPITYKKTMLDSTRTRLAELCMSLNGEKIIDD